MRPTRYTKGIGETICDIIWAIICVKPAVVNTIDYLADWKHHNGSRVKRNLTIGASVLFFVGCIAIIGFSIANAGKESKYDRANRRADAHSAELQRMTNSLTGRGRTFDLFGK